MKKVLLFADIGGHDTQQYYHVGDEAMFFETYRWYQKNHPDWSIQALTWFPSQGRLKLTEVPHLHWQKNWSSLYFPLLCAKVLCSKLLRISFFTPQEQRLVSTIKSVDQVHFTGGGNISSQFRQWLYYCFFVIVTARLYNKQILLTSQTIGPITGIDKLFAFFFLNLPDLIAIRSQTTRFKEFMKYGAFYPKIRSMLDAAHTIPWKNVKIPSQDMTRLTLGLSLHEWSGFERKTAKIVQALVQKLAQQCNLTVLLIPHHLNTPENRTDLEFMIEVLSSVQAKIQIHAPKVPEILLGKTNPASFTKSQTAKCDLIVSSRYHGIIFALSTNTPVIALNFDTYYQEKNNGALNRYFGKKSQRYEVSLSTPMATLSLQEKTKRILKNHTNEQRYLQRKNAILHQGSETLDSILIEFERKKIV